MPEAGKLISMQISITRRQVGSDAGRQGPIL